MDRSQRESIDIPAGSLEDRDYLHTLEAAARYREHAVVHPSWKAAYARLAEAVDILDAFEARTECSIEQPTEPRGLHDDNACDPA